MKKENKELTKITGVTALERAIVGLITPAYNSNSQPKPFYAHFIQNCERSFDKSIPTIGVYVTDKVHLVINEDFFLSVSPLERIAILEHEVLHLVFGHLTRFKPKHMRIWNASCDISVNQFIENLPKTALSPKQFKLKENMEAEYYYKELLKNAKTINIQVVDGKGNNNENGEGDKNNLKTIDDHKIWDKSNSNKDITKTVVKGNIKNSIKNIKDYGNVPAQIQAELLKILGENLINWKRELNRFINKATIVKMALTRKRPNRRYADYEGNKNVYKLKLLIGLDTSGSIDDRTLSEFFGQINKVKSLGFDIQVAECDCKLGNVYKYKQQPKKVTGRGGTAFEPIFDYAKKYKPDIIVYLTDGYANKNFKYKIPTLWIITADGNEKGFKFGKVVKMKPFRNIE